jgi:hypothetical protein
MGSLALQPDDSLTIPKMVLSIGFTGFVSSTGAIQATGPDSCPGGSVSH